jgi:hypothetical protein
MPTPARGIGATLPLQRISVKRTAFILALLLPLAHVNAEAAASEPAKPVGPAERKAVVVELDRQLQANYVFPDVAKRVGAALRRKEAAGGYAASTDVDAFAKALTGDLRAQGNDLHFNVRFDPDFKPEPTSPEALTDVVPDPKEVEFAARRGYGVESVQRLPGNVGYLEIRGFGPTELVGQAMSAAMLLLSGTDALILDLRRNGGGDPNTVAHLMSHFFALGDSRHLNDIYSRADGTTRQFWTSNAVMPRYLKPVYVLTSKDTFSGGEECAYDMQTQKRAMLVGETTGGGANPGTLFAVGHGFAAFIPDMRAINPITHTSWEHTGVKPDVAVEASKARHVAHVAILRELIAKASTPGAKSRLEEALAGVEAEAPAGK